MRKWEIEDSAELYNINGWGKDFFSINAKGNIEVRPKLDGPRIDLMEIMGELGDRDVSAPVLLRFPDILASRIASMASCFRRAAREYEYTGENFVIYPVKVNQMRPVVEEIVKHGKQFNIGLEAGSKPELHAVLALTNHSEALIVCNGYKDENYIELALLAQKMGRRVHIVVEKPNELRIICRLARRMGVRPNIGLRIKLSSSGSGKWEDSGGDHSKFGLTSSELLDALDFLRAEGTLDALKLLHFHIGSQVTKIRKIKIALQEAAQFYVEVSRLGARVEFVDIGGGLGVDYDGTRSANSASSVNYSIQEYVNDAISAFVLAANQNELPHPNVITESGRAITAHHSILVFEVMESASLPTWRDEDQLPEEPHDLVQEIFELHRDINVPNLLETWHDAQQVRDEVLSQFPHGHIPLEVRAQVEKLFWGIAHRVVKIAQGLKHVPPELETLPKMLADKYFCNFSLFQSLPDSWAIDQIFPITPLHRLNEKPDRQATLQDITCDSDGKIENFISTSNRAYHLPVHQLRPGEPYYIGVFLVGAYQEILGDLHNLFGDTNAVHITVTDQGYHIDQVIDAETVEDVLDYVQYNSKKLVRTVETWVKSSIQKGLITPDEGKEFLANYRSGLYGSTYLER